MGLMQISVRVSSFAMCHVRTLAEIALLLLLQNVICMTYRRNANLTSAILNKSASILHHYLSFAFINALYAIRFLERYLNTVDIRDALGVDSEFGNFTLTNFVLNEAFWFNGDPFHLNQYYIAELLARGVRVLIYVGAYDFVANWVGSERWTVKMEWTGKEKFGKEELKEWSVLGKPAGLAREYGNFSFATIYGAGHLVSGTTLLTSLSKKKNLII